MRATDSIVGPLERQLEALGLTEGRFGVLEILLHLGDQTAGQLCRKSFRSGGNITTVLDNLERDGLVRRARDPADRRSVVVSLTPKGRRLVGRVMPVHVAAIVKAYGALNAHEQATLERLLRKLGLGRNQQEDSSRR